MTEVTPLRAQYLDLKAQYPDHILFFRLGDFYETFDEDAKTTAEVLDLVLTGRPVSRNVRVPMAGFPHHVLERNVERMVAAGYRVAVAEQVSEPNGRTLVEREVTRTVEPADDAVDDDEDDHADYQQLAAEAAGYDIIAQQIARGELPPDVLRQDNMSAPKSLFDHLVDLSDPVEPDDFSDSLAGQVLLQLGAQEPPQDPMIYNRRQPDGTFKPLSGFFDRKAESEPDPDAYYASLEREHHANLDAAEDERDVQQFFDENGFEPAPLVIPVVPEATMTLAGMLHPMADYLTRYEQYCEDSDDEDSFWHWLSKYYDEAQFLSALSLVRAALRESERAATKKAALAADGEDVDGLLKRMTEDGDV